MTAYSEFLSITPDLVFAQPANSTAADHPCLTGFISAAGDRIKWSGRHAPPSLGATFLASMNGWGRCTVIGYFAERGWLGVLASPMEIPAWYIEQHRPPAKIIATLVRALNRSQHGFYNQSGCRFQRARTHRGNLELYDGSDGKWHASTLGDAFRDCYGVAIGTYGEPVTKIHFFGVEVEPA